MQIKGFIKTHQTKIALVTGYLVVASLAFGLGRFGFQKNSANQYASQQDNYTPNIAGAQTTMADTNDAASCQGKIKGSASMIYHVPGGAFYTKTTHPVQCFDTEAQAMAAGYRKSSR